MKPDAGSSVASHSDLLITAVSTPTLTKADLAEMLFERMGLTKRDAKVAVDTFFDLLAQTLAAGDEVKLSGFGSFQVRSKAERPGRNPRTGEPVPIAARRVVTFHASPKLKESVQQESPSGDFE